MRSGQARRYTVQRLLLSALAALTLLIFVFCARDLYTESKRLGEIRALRDATTIADQIYDAADKFSVERDIASSLLAARDAETIADLRPRLFESRQLADQALDASGAKLDRYDFTDLAAVRARIETRKAVVRGLRQAVDAASQEDFERRDPALTARWSREANLLVEETQSLWTGFQGHFLDVDPIATQHLQYKQYLRSVVDYAGRERSLIGQLLANNSAPTAGEAAQLLRDQGVVEAGWKGGRTAAQQSGLQPQIGRLFDDAESHYFSMRDMTKDLFFFSEGSRRVRYPISAALWFDLSNEASDTLDDLTIASTNASKRYLDDLVGESWRLILFRVAFCAFALLLCAYVLWVTIARVSRPIRKMVEALVAATHGERVDLELIGSSAGDEITKLADVLVAYQKTVEQAKQAATELDRSERRLRAVLDNAFDGVMTLKSDGTIVTFNPACTRILGYEAREAVGESIDLLGEAAGAVHAILSSTELGESQNRASQEIMLRRKDGAGFPADLSVSAFALDEGRHVSLILRDITARKQAEEALVAHTKALERSNKELDDFAYIASHDLKEPLRGIHNHSRFLMEDNSEKLDEESVRRLNRLLYLSQRMERLVNDLLYFSRLGRQDMAFQRVEIGPVISDVEATLEYFLQERGAEIVMRSPLPTVFCDRTRVTEVFRNLITNAVKYNDKPQKIIEIGFLPFVAVAGRKVRRDVFFIRDNGRGIAPEFHTEVFRIFRRLKADGGEEGTGVGLTFVKKIIERHGGKIWIESAIDQGSTFFFTLEACDEEDDEKRADEAA